MSWALLSFLLTGSELGGYPTPESFIADACQGPSWRQ